MFFKISGFMEMGIQLGRPFRALKPWMVLRYFGAEGIRARITEHIRLAQQFAHWFELDLDFQLLAPVPLGLVCFRVVPRLHKGDAESLNRLDEALLESINATGEVFLSHTRLNGCYVLRLAVGQIQTSEVHVAKAWELLRETVKSLTMIGR